MSLTFGFFQHLHETSEKPITSRSNCVGTNLVKRRVRDSPGPWKRAPLRSARCPLTLNASQHHQSSSHSKQIAAIPYSRQIGQFRQTQLNFGASSVTNRQTWKSKNFSSKHLSSVFNKLAHHITLEILCHSCPFWQDFSSETTQYVWNGGHLSTIYFSRSASSQVASGREGM